MQRILIIKLTSLGDLVHALPAITDIHRAFPHLEIDWMIDENFQEVATFHPAIRNIYTTNHRKWHREWMRPPTYKSIFSLIRNIRKTKYDLIIDGQGNFKSAFFTYCTRGTRAGCDRKSAAEKIASLAYQKRYPVPQEAHAIWRLRKLFSLALDYPFPNTPPDYGIDTTRFSLPPIALPSEYLTFIHNASWQTKLWPESHWQELIKLTVQCGYKILLPWGNKEEHARAKRLQISDQVTVLPKLSLKEIGYVLKNSLAAISMDTGLSHLTAALGTPSITLYGATNSGLIGASGPTQLHLNTTLPCAPCDKKECKFNTYPPPCLASITPKQVFSKLQKLLTTERREGEKSPPNIPW